MTFIVLLLINEFGQFGGFMPMFRFEPIKGRKNFQEAFEKGIRFYEQDAAATVVFREPAEGENNEEDGCVTVQYAVSISKRTAKKAAVRNRIKRLLRESLKKTVMDNMGNIEKIFLNWRTAPSHPALIRLRDVQPVVDALVHRAAGYCRKKIQNRQN